MGQNFGMTATYGQHKDKTGSWLQPLQNNSKKIRWSRKQRNCEYNHQTQRKL
jgi:hypothetical protein